MAIRTNKIGLPVFADWCKILLTFLCVSFGMIIFRSTSVDSFLQIIGCFRSGLFTLPDIGAKIAWILVGLMVAIEWIQRNKEYGLEISGIKQRSIRWCIYLIFMFIIYCLGGGVQHFIYQVF